jgi:ferredoxin
MPELRIEPAGLSLPAPLDRTLLEAVRAAGVRLASSCRNGTCRACMCRMRSGQIRYTLDWPGLLAEEQLDGWILPCVALPLSDVVIEATVVADPGGLQNPV